MLTNLMVTQIPLSLFDALADTCQSWDHLVLERELEKWISAWECVPPGQGKTQHIIEHCQSHGIPYISI